LNALGKYLAGCLVLAAAPITVATAVSAHPHVFVDAMAAIVFDAQGRISAVSNVWEFDEAFTAFAVEGLDQNGDGKLSDAELAPLAKVNIDSLKEYDYFTYLLSGDTKNVFVTPTEYRLEYHGNRLTLFFTLPLKDPVPVDGTATVEIFDPEYFVAFTFVKNHPVSLQGAPAGCTATYQPPHELDAATMADLAAIPMDQHDLPPDLLKVAVRLANLVKINCPASAAPVAQAADAAPEPRLSPRDLPSGTLTPTDFQASATSPPSTVSLDDPAASPAPPPAADAAVVPPVAAPPSGDVITADFGDNSPPAAPMRPKEPSSEPRPASMAAAAGVAPAHVAPASLSRLIGLTALFVAFLAAIAGAVILLRRKPGRLR
jgi:ABC-type uncharacterized transport system substrate-binding protein